MASPVQEVMDLIDNEGDPTLMSKQEWVDFLEEIISECESRAEAARSEMADA